jgi:hypothetical protein
MVFPVGKSLLEKKKGAPKRAQGSGGSKLQKITAVQQDKLNFEL